VQLSIDGTQPAQFHYEIGRRLAPLRDEGVLILGSGNVVHNLRAYDFSGVAAPLPWAENFENRTRELLLARDHAALIDYPALGRDAMLSIPTPEHYLPLLYVAGAAADVVGPVKFPLAGIDGGSVSMLAVEL
jgi:4,5-DOPA dioxygenase extradiol